MTQDISSLSDEILKKFIINESKDLEKSDYIDILTILVTKLDNNNALKTSQRGTFVDLDSISRDLLIMLYSIVHSKIQRIRET
jgi:hypothetical protein